MDNKIDVLMKQSYVDINRDTRIFSPEKFAELIVQECAAFLRLGSGREGYEEGKRLKRHFGIKDNGI